MLFSNPDHSKEMTSSFRTVFSRCLIAVGFLIAVHGLWGQENLISINYKDVEFRDVLNHIEVQTGLVFSYNNRLFDDRERITLKIEELPLDEVLRILFRDMQIQYFVIEQQIILKRDRRTLFQDNSTKESEPVTGVRYTVSGYVKDAATGELLIGASIVLSDRSAGTITNEYGFFSLTLEEQFDSIECSYIGYNKVLRSLKSEDQRMEFNLEEKRQSIGEVYIISEEMRETIRTARSSEEKVRPASVRKMPALFGEKDVIKSLAAIPGIKFFGDGSTIFYVRGGGRDQNMVTIDEAPVYNPTHMLGLFSTIVPDAVKEIKVYKGDFPANYGGRLASHISIRTKDGNMQQFGMDGTIGILSSRISVEGPIWKDHISYFISGRKSYFLKPLQQANDGLQDLHFSDLHVKLNYRINDKNRIFLTQYASNDNFEARQGASGIAGINWQNGTTTFRWNHLFSEKLFLNTTIYASRYDYFLNTNLEQGDYWNSHINNFSLKTDFTWYLSPSNTLRFGAKLAQHFMNPGNFYQNHTLLPLPYIISTKNVNESCLYFSDQLLLTDRLSLRMGLRITAWNSIGPATEYGFEEGSLQVSEHGYGHIYNSYITGDPRLGLVYELESGDLLKFSYSRASQFEHLITNSISPFSSLEVWLPSGPNIKPARADQLTAGYTQFFNGTGIKAWAEFYIRRTRNQIDYRDHAKLLMNPFIDFELRFGEADAYGIETMISKNAGNLQGWISYTWSRSLYTINGINQGNPYPAYGDRPHDLSFFVSFKATPRLEISGNFIYMTGSPFTAPTAFYYQENIQVPVYFKRNNDRLPDYHRFDIACNWNLRKREGRFKHEMIFSIYNLYGRKNPVAIHFNKIENGSGELVTPTNYYAPPQLIPTQLFLFTVVPSISYHFSF
jgi:hypothetical protein